VHQVKDPDGLLRTVTHLEEILVTANETYLTSVDSCPAKATKGCRDAIMNKIAELSEPINRAGLLLGSLLYSSIVLGCLLYVRQGQKPKTTPLLQNATAFVLMLESLFTIIGLVILFTGADLVGGYGFFVSGTIAKVWLIFECFLLNISVHVNRYLG
jgi:hypothetical protein